MGEEWVTNVGRHSSKMPSRHLRGDSGWPRLPRHAILINRTRIDCQGNPANREY